MSTNSTLQGDICKRLRMVGLPKEEVLPIVNTIHKQVVAEGPENVVKRLKLLKQAAINHLAGREQRDLSWIAHTRQGVPKGCWKPVWEKLMSTSYKKRKIAFNTFMVYTSLVLPKREGPTKIQERKFLGSVEIGIEEQILRSNAVRQLTIDAERSARLGLTLQRDFREAYQSVTKLGVNKIPYESKVPDYIEWLGPKMGFDHMKIKREERNLFNFLGSDTGRAFTCFPEVQEALGAIKDDWWETTHPSHGFLNDWRVSKEPSDPIGVIGSSQEPGMKFRAFASPHRLLQCALVPLQKHLLKVLQNLPWDCTHDQMSGVQKVQEWLKEKKMVYSVDLSDATNNFPLDYQERVLNTMFVNKIPESTLKLIHNVARSPYRLMWDRERCVSWTVGQPLGAGPSFMMFALSHSVLALQAEVRAGIKPELRGSTFLILGDDIVINDQKVHEHYRDLLKTLRCPVSESKCLQSDLAAEFAGKLITANHVYHGYKFGEISNQSFISVIQTLGRPALSRQLLTKDQYTYAKAFECIPEELGGLGFNPKGYSYSLRYEYYLTLKEVLDLRKGDDKSLTRAEIINKTLYAMAERAPWEKGKPFSQTYASWWNGFYQRGPLSRSERKPNSLSEQIMMNVRNDNDLVPMMNANSDPRPDPLIGLKRKIMDNAAVTARVFVNNETAEALGLEETQDSQVEVDYSVGFAPWDDCNESQSDQITRSNATGYSPG